MKIARRYYRKPISLFSRPFPLTYHHWAPTEEPANQAFSPNP